MGWSKELCGGKNKISRAWPGIFRAQEIGIGGELKSCAVFKRLDFSLVAGPLEIDDGLLAVFGPAHNEIGSSLELPQHKGIRMLFLNAVNPVSTTVEEFYEHACGSAHCLPDISPFAVHARLNQCRGFSCNLLVEQTDHRLSRRVRLRQLLPNKTSQVVADELVSQSAVQKLSLRHELEATHETWPCIVRSI